MEQHDQQAALCVHKCSPRATMTRVAASAARPRPPDETRPTGAGACRGKYTATSGCGAGSNHINDTALDFRRYNAPSPPILPPEPPIEKTTWAGASTSTTIFPSPPACGPHSPPVTSRLRHLDDASPPRGRTRRNSCAGVADTLAKTQAHALELHHTSTNRVNVGSCPIRRVHSSPAAASQPTNVWDVYAGKTSHGLHSDDPVHMHLPGLGLGDTALIPSKLSKSKTLQHEEGELRSLVNSIFDSGTGIGNTLLDQAPHSNPALDAHVRELHLRIDRLLLYAARMSDRCAASEDRIREEEFHKSEIKRKLAEEEVRLMHEKMEEFRKEAISHSRQWQMRCKEVEKEMQRTMARDRHEADTRLQSVLDGCDARVLDAEEAVRQSMAEQIGDLERRLSVELEAASRRQRFMDHAAEREARLGDEVASLRKQLRDGEMGMMELAHLVSSLRHTDEELHEMQRRVVKAEQGAIDAHAALKKASETMVKWKAEYGDLQEERRQKIEAQAVADEQRAMLDRLTALQMTQADELGEINSKMASHLVTQRVQKGKLESMLKDGAAFEAAVQAEIERRRQELVPRY